MTEPRYWMYETGGELSRAIARYLQCEKLTVRHVALIRAYFRQWIDAEAWDVNPHQSPESKLQLNELRRDVLSISDRDSINRWVERAVEFGADPL